MPNPFQTAINMPAEHLVIGSSPALGDPMFWANVLMTQRAHNAPLVEFSLVSSGADQLVDDLGNSFFGVT